MVGSTACSSLPYGVGGKTLFLKGSVHASPQRVTSFPLSLIWHLSAVLQLIAYLTTTKRGRPSYSKRFQKALLPSPIITPGKMGFCRSNSLHTLAKKPRQICDYLMGEVSSLIGLPFSFEIMETIAKIKSCSHYSKGRPRRRMNPNQGPGKHNRL